MKNGNETVVVGGQEMELVERKEPRFVKFETQGEVVNGTLMRVESVEIEGKRTARFVVDDEGELLAFLGTADIVNKLRQSDIGKYVAVMFEGLNRSVTKNGNAMKVFKIGVSKDPVKNSAGTAITSADVAF